MSQRRGFRTVLTGEEYVNQVGVPNVQPPSNPPVHDAPIPATRWGMQNIAYGLNFHEPTDEQMHGDKVYIGREGLPHGERAPGELVNQDARANRRVPVVESYGQQVSGE